MKTISDIQKAYFGKIDLTDIEILIVDSIGKSREFILAHPEYEIPSLKIEKLKLKISRRLKGEPIAYILGHKEFYGLDFMVNKHTLIPRPETELLVEIALDQLKVHKVSKVHKVIIVDIGTGSGNIIVSITKAIEKSKIQNATAEFVGIDISKDALKIAKKNAAIHNLDKKIAFLNGSLLTPIIENCKLKIENSKMIILANLPYLSKEIYQSAPIDVKKFEPKTALYSPEQGLQHYRRLLEQLKDLLAANRQLQISLLLEISPEQKTLLPAVIKPIFPKAKVSFQKDLAGKWRVCKIII